MFLFLFLCPFSPLLATRHHLQAISISTVSQNYIFLFTYIIRPFIMDLVLDSILFFCMITGKAGVNFYTQIKTITQNWKDSDSDDKINMAMPTSQKS